MVTRVRKSNFAQGAITTEKLNQSSFTCNLFDITEYDSIGAFPTDTTTVGALGYIAGDSAADSDRIYGNIGRGWYQITGIQSSCYRISNITPIDVLIVGGGGVGSALGRIGDVGGGGGGGVVAFTFCPTNEKPSIFNDNVLRDSAIATMCVTTIGSGGTFNGSISAPVIHGKPSCFCISTPVCSRAYVAPGGEAGSYCTCTCAGVTVPAAPTRTPFVGRGGRSAFFANGQVCYGQLNNYCTSGECIRNGGPPFSQSSGCQTGRQTFPNGVVLCWTTRGGGGGGAGGPGSPGGMTCPSTPSLNVHLAGLGGAGYTWCDGIGYGAGGGGGLAFSPTLACYRIGSGGFSGGGEGDLGCFKCDCNVFIQSCYDKMSGQDYTGGGGGAGARGRCYAGGKGGDGVVKFRFQTGAYCDVAQDTKLLCITGPNVVWTDSNDGYTYVEFRDSASISIPDTLIGFNS